MSDEREGEKDHSRGPEFDVVGPTRHLRPPDDPPDEDPGVDGEGEAGQSAVPSASDLEEQRSLEEQTLHQWEPEPAQDEPVSGPEAEQGVLDLFYGVLFNPAPTMRIFRHRTPYGAAFLSFMVASLVSTWLIADTVPPILDELGLPFDAAVLPAIAMVSVAVGLFSWLLSAAVFHLAADFLGGQGRARSLFVAIGFAYLPRVFTGPVTLLDQAVAFDLGFLSLAISIWVIYLFYIAIREVEGLDTLPSVAVLLSPLVVFVGFVVVFVLFVMLFGSALIPLLEGAATGI